MRAGGLPWLLEQMKDALLYLLPEEADLDRENFFPFSTVITLILAFSF